MNSRDLAETLEGIGLTEKEAQTYDAGLRLGPASVKTLSQATGIKRTTLYSVIDHLAAKGLLYRETKGLKQLFVMESPQKLQELYETKASALKNCIAELISVQKYGMTENAVRYYEGTQAIRGAYNGILEDYERGKDYLIISNQESWHRLDPTFFQNYLERRAKLDIPVRYLLVDSPLAREHQRLQANYRATIKILPRSITFDANLVIIPRRVLITQLIPPVFAMTIDNKNIAMTLAHLFRVIWQVI